jgi:hypothetical protein
LEDQTAAPADPEEQADADGLGSSNPLAVFVRDAVEGYLVAQGLEYEINDHGDLVFKLKEQPAGRNLSVNVQLPFDDELGPVLQIECWPDLELDEAQAAPAAGVCADWNREEWWPKAYVDRPGDGEPETLVLEYSLPLGKAVSQLGVEEFMAAFKTGAVNFWKRIDLEHADLLAPPPV